MPGICLAMLTAWLIQSVPPRLPKPPPSINLYTSHLDAGRPEASEAAAKAASPFWVGVQTSHISGVPLAETLNLTVAFIGSMVA